MIMANLECSTIHLACTSLFVLLLLLLLPPALPFSYDTNFSTELQGWFIFTFLLMTCTVKSTVAFFSLFFTVDIAFLLIAIGYLVRNDMGEPNHNLLKAGGLFALLAAFLAWYVALAGIADSSNSFFIVPVWHFPWSEKGRKSRRQQE